MAVIHTEQKRFNLVVPVLAVGTVAVVASVWWYQQTSTPTSVTPLAPMGSASVASVSEGTTSPALQPAVAAEAAATPQVMEKLVEEQKQAVKVIEEQPQLKPLTGPVTERPSFISEMEWSVFKSVAMQQTDPDKALTALVNKVRFFKQLEVLQDMPPTAAPSKRQALAHELLDDLPERLKNGDFDHTGATQLLDQLLTSAEPDLTKRKALAVKQTKALQQVQQQLTQAAAAAAADKQAAASGK